MAVAKSASQTCCQWARLSMRVVMAHTDRWLGHTTLQGVGQVVDEVSPYEVDLDWENINDLDEILEVLGYLGQATAKTHSGSDEDSDQTPVTASAEHAIHERIAGRKDECVAAMIDFGQQYGAGGRVPVWVVREPVVIDDMLADSAYEAWHKATRVCGFRAVIVFAGLVSVWSKLTQKLI
jgi:hypothetical protein